MSLEAALAENTAALNAHSELLKVVTANQERLLAGQQAAIDKIEAPRAARTSRKAADAPKGNSEPAATASGAADAGGVSDEGVSVDALFEYASGYLAEFNPKTAGDKADAAKHQERGKFLMGMLSDEFGGAKIKEISDADDRKRALFYLKRFAAGQPVDFKADYDFDGEPAQAAEAEEFEIG